MHEKTKEFQASFSETKSKMWATLSGVIYAKHIPERFLAPSRWEERFFEKLITDLEMREYANLLIYDSMRNVYGTTPNTNAPDIAGGCLGLFYASRFSSAASPVDVFAPEALCTQLKSKAETNSGFPTGSSISKDFQEQMVNRSRDWATSNQSGNMLTKSEFDSRAETAQGDKSFKFSRDSVGRIAFQNVTGQTLGRPGTYGSSVQGQRNRVRQRRAQNNTSNQFGIDIDSPNNALWGNQSLDDEVRDVINDTYTVGSGLDNARLSQGQLNQSSNLTVVTAGNVSVTSNTTSGTRSYDITLPVTIREDSKAGVWVKNVNFSATTRMNSTVSLNTTVDEPGVKYPNCPPTSYTTHRYPTYRNASYSSVLFCYSGNSNQQNTNSGQIESSLENNMDTNVTSAGEFETEVTNVISTSVSTQAHSPPTNRRTPFQDWLIDELNETRKAAYNATTDNTTVTELLNQSHDTFEELKINDTEADALVYNGTRVNGQYGRSGQYRTPATKSLAELRKRWVETVNWYINKTQNRTQKRIKKINSVLQTKNGPNTPDTMHEGYKSAKDNASNPFSIDGGTGNIINGSSNSNSNYQVDADPTWLSHVPNPPGSVDGATAKDEIREDTEGVHYTGLAMRKVYPLPNPGYPFIVPAPPFWVLSLNAGTYNMNGQYARFMVQPNAPENHVANTSYVRQAQPVSLSFNGVRRNVGRVEPIAFDWEMGLPLVTVGGGVLRQGSKGIGDYIGVDLNPFLDCTPTWPEVGSMPREPSRANANCADAGVYGEMAAGLLQPARFAKGNRDRKKLEQKYPDGFGTFEDKIRDRLITPMDNIKKAPAVGAGRAVDRARWGIASKNARNSPAVKALKRQVKDFDIKLEANKRYKRDYYLADGNTRGLRRFDKKGEDLKRSRGRFREQLDAEYDGLRLSKFMNLKQKTKIPDAVNPEENTGMTVTISREVAMAAAISMRQGSYDGAECPAVKYEDDIRTGCDDNQLEVEVYPSGDGHVVAIESEIRHTSRDKTLFVQARPGGSDPYFQGSSSFDKRVEGNIDYSAKQTSNTNLASLHQSGGSYEVTDQNISGTRDVSYAQEVVLGYTNVTVIEADSAGTAPMLRVNYDGYTFLIALAENGADWDHFRSKLTTDDYRAETVNVFIGTEAAQRELGDRLSPRSSVVLSSSGTPQYTCGDSTQGIYNGTQSVDMLKFRVDEEKRLFGPDQTPDTFC
ncbi:DUF7286 family protein [Haloarcula salinisoli]|uniref:Uncharacterized protein n=2 Tax=Haloarcula salinisoli TaxID=2487746 RepID=A0A8J8CE18_9EURY|nr:hypothetical protein [Halomicroarcula salinisoli]MBX0305200.1 hypothetical protein [Halomicroarcula salinisoli]